MNVGVADSLSAKIINKIKGVEFSTAKSCAKSIQWSQCLQFPSVNIQRLALPAIVSLNAIPSLCRQVAE
jgi:hypothetical protein